MTKTHVVYRSLEGGAVLFYISNGTWTTKECEAQLYTPEQASVVCENLAVRGTIACFGRALPMNA